MISSYEINNYGPILESLARNCLGGSVVELGVLHGYSASYLASGILGKGRLIAYDLFGDYKYKHGNFKEVKERLSRFNNIELIKGDAFEVHCEFLDGTIGLLHVDLSNTGDIIKCIIDLWDKKIAPGGVIVLEGGSVERDNIEWMKKYNKSSIRTELEKNKTINANYIWGVFEMFPSITVMYKR